MNIGFSINRLGMVGLGATITSMLRNCSQPDLLVIWILCADLLDQDKVNIQALLEKEHFNGQFHLIDISPQIEFGDLHPLHGDWTNYGRLLLPKHIADDKVLYLDSDIVIEEDVLKFNTFELNDYGLAAVPTTPLGTVMEHYIYVTLMALNPLLASFNSGVLLINLDYWRKNKIKEQCKTLGLRLKPAAKFRDQVLLNIIFAGSYKELPVHFNYEWAPHLSIPVNKTNGQINHFIGSPKPWDICGRFIHSGHATWAKYADVNWINEYKTMDRPTLRRTWKIRRSYLRTLYIKSGFSKKSCEKN